MNNRLYIWGFLTLLAIYIGLAFGLPSDPEVLKQYDITQSEARWLNATIVLPFAVVYLSALYGFLKFKDYADTIATSKEGAGFKLLSRGLMILTFGLPVSSIAGSLVNYMAIGNENLLPYVTITRNYLLLIIAFTGFYLISVGADRLVATLKSKRSLVRQTPNLVGVIALTSIFTWLITTQPPEAAAGKETYYLPVWLILATIAIPYLYIWVKGIMSVYRLGLYKTTVGGTVYKQSIALLSKGIGAIIFLSILIQILTTLSAKINRLDLAPLLLIIYALVVLYAVGYGFVARGAKKLKQIEEV